MTRRYRVARGGSVALGVIVALAPGQSGFQEVDAIARVGGLPIGVVVDVEMHQNGDVFAEVETSGPFAAFDFGDPYIDPAKLSPPPATSEEVEASLDALEKTLGR